MQRSAEAIRQLLTPAARVMVLLALLCSVDVGSPTTAAGLLAATAAVALVHVLTGRAYRSGHPAAGARVTGAPARDEKCRRGAFRRQSSPRARGRVRPRAPQLG